MLQHQPCDAVGCQGSLPDDQVAGVCSRLAVVNALTCMLVNGEAVLATKLIRQLVPKHLEPHLEAEEPVFWQIGMAKFLITIFPGRLVAQPSDGLEIVKNQTPRKAYIRQPLPER